MTNHNEETSFIYGSVAGHRRKRTGLGGEVRHLGRKKEMYNAGEAITSSCSVRIG